MNIKRLAVLVTATAMVLSLAAPVSAASPHGKADSKGPKSDNFPGELAKKQAALKKVALDKVLKGEAKAVGKNKVVKVANGQYVELAFEGQDQIFTLLGQFGPTPNNTHAGHPAHGGGPGPLHNTIPEPDRAVDNTTIWTDDFSQSYYDDLLYDKTQNPSLANWYLAQSSGRYSVDGYVGDWVTVPNNAAAYGSNYCGSIVCTRDVGRFMRDQATAWYNSLIGTGKTAAEIEAILAPFDVWDRYDFDNDGNFDEPDGYIDHFQSVHAGEGEETGGGALGTDAIWSHRSYANGGVAGVGPVVGGVPNNAAGIQIGGSSKWIGDYTIEPENGGVGVFGHEFAHDLGLPDEYDTSGNTGGAENGTAWWTMMSQGSYGTVNGIDLGSAPVDFSAWDKLVLGWLNYDFASSSGSSSHKISAAEINTKQAQALIVSLPPKEVTTVLGAPYAGSYFYHSGSGNDLDTTMTKTFTLGAGPISLSFQGRWHIETCWDYAYLQVSTDGGTTYTNIQTSASDPGNENGQNDGFGIDGVSGSPKVCDDLSATPQWVPVTADLSAYANSTIQVRFNYETDGAVVGEGFGVDDLAITGQAVDGAETDTGWTFNGFSRTTGSTTVGYPNYYIAEYRTYKGYDKGLQLGPYNFTDPNGNLVEHFPNQDGLLIWYYDTSQNDNNVGDHPGEGLILPIDANPGVLHWSDGSTARPRIQSYDSTFGVDKTDGIVLHNTAAGLTLTRTSLPAARTFNDDLSYWVSGDPGDAPANGRYQAEWASVNNPHTGTIIKVASVSAQGSFMQVLLNP